MPKKLALEAVEKVIHHPEGRKTKFVLRYNMWVTARMRKAMNEYFVHFVLVVGSSCSKRVTVFLDHEPDRSYSLGSKELTEVIDDLTKLAAQA